MKKRDIQQWMILILIISALTALSGCGMIVVEDNYSLDRIDGDITCKYRTGEEAKWSEEYVDSDVQFDKDMFLKLFQEYAQYDPIIGSKDPTQCDLRIKIDETPEEWQMIRKSEFNVTAVFGNDQRDVSIYRHGGKLYFYVLSMGDRREPEMEGEYFFELPEEMSDYWQTIIDDVEASIQCNEIYTRVEKYTE